MNEARPSSVSKGPGAYSIYKHVHRHKGLGSLGIGLPASAINEADEDDFGPDFEIRERNKEEESDEGDSEDADSNEGESEEPEDSRQDDGSILID